MYVKDVVVQNQGGLRARPATFFIQKANSYKSTIWLEEGGRRINAKSLLGVLSMGIVKGTNITLISDGADEEEAESLRERIRQAPEKFSNAGSYGAYRYHTLSAHQSIIDVAINHSWGR